MAVENTADRDPAVHFLGMVSEGSDNYITGMEAAGQRQLVASDTIPVDGSDDLAELGFTLGDLVPNDTMFRHVTLPAGWRKERTDHPMWSKIVDEHGRERVSIFYKAAFYDRSAFCRVVTVEGYLRQLTDGEAAPILDDTWATREVMAAACRALIDDETRQIDQMAALDSPRKQEFVDRHEKQRDEYRTLLAKVESEASAP